MGPAPDRGRGFFQNLEKSPGNQQENAVLLLATPTDSMVIFRSWAGLSPPGTPSNPAAFMTAPADPNRTLPPAGPLDPPAAAIPRRIGDYDIIAPIASGGMGVVYKARHATLDRLVAIKTMLRAETASPDEIRRFHAEAEAAAQLDHPGIVPIYEVGEEDGRHYFSMAFVEGGSLLASLGDGPMEPLAAAGLVRSVAEAVAYAHERGVIHRDLKPGNILLSSGGSPKVTDFGLAKRVETAGDLTHTGQVLGTPSYMPPEQARGDLTAIGPLADVYALGAVLYHALTGRAPFAAATPWATLRQVLENEPVPPRQLNPQVDRDLETIAIKCLEKEPNRRYGSAAAVAADLRRFIAGEPIVARRTPAWERAWKWSRRRPALAGLAAVSLIAVLSTTLGGLLYVQAAAQRVRLAEADMRERTRELRERDAIDNVRRDVQAALGRCGGLLDAGSLQEAEVGVAEALAKVVALPALSEERLALEALSSRLAERRTAERERAAARSRLAAFDAHRDAAMFLGSQAYGLDPLANQRQAAAEAAAGLALFTVDPAAPETALPAWESAAFAVFSPAERAAIRDGCYELLLVFADATRQAAGSEPAARTGEATLAAVRLAAAVIGRETPATRLQRAACLAVRDVTGASSERADVIDTAPAETAIDNFLVGKMLAQPGAAVDDRDFKRATSFFEQALVLDPDHFWAQYSLATQGLRLGRPDLADVHLTACIGRRPEFVWAWILRGSARTALGHFDLAKADFARAFTLAPDPEARHVALVNRAVLEVAQGRPDEARASLREAIDLEPTAFQAVLSLATVEAREGRSGEALALLDKALALEPDAAVVHRERGRLLASRGEFAAAERHLQAAARLERGASSARADDLALAGQMLFRQQRYDDALVAWEAALAVDPGHPQSHLWKAALLVDRGRFAEALSSFDAFLERGRPNVEFHLTRGMCRASLGNYVAAIDDYSRALELRPHASAYVQRGWLYALRGNPVFGLQDFEKAIAHDPEHADAHCGRGLALAHVGRHADAAAAAEQALALGERSFAHGYKVATVYAAVAPRVVLSEEERRKQGPTPGQLRVKYIQRAAELLDRALGREADHLHDDLWQAHVREDEHFRQLLQEPEFRRLEADVVKRSGSGSGAAASPVEVSGTGTAHPGGEAAR